MKAILYAVYSGGSWRAMFSVAWEADELIWRGKAERLVRAREPVPLGVAERVCATLSVKWRNQSVLDAKRCGDELREALRARWAEASDSVPFETEEVELPAGEGKAGQANAEALAAAARLAAEQLRGRSLLREEAAELLAGVLPAAGASPLAALQLAALQGALQLTAAVAPKAQAAPPRGGFRAWAERRLRLARLLPGRAAGRPEELACRRCGSGKTKLRRTSCAACGQACAYCEACLTMGRSRECGLLIIGAPPAGSDAEARSAGRVAASGTTLPSVAAAGTASPSVEASGTTSLSVVASGTALPTVADTDETQPIGTAAPVVPARLVERWGLSPAQGDAAAQALRFLLDRNRKGDAFLLWAVTGAGKTEMIFPLLESVLSVGGRALVATPRRDVVLELAPRLAKAFPNYSRAVLYGGCEDRWKIGELTLATTHQLLRFQEAFDLVLIDELDALAYDTKSI